MPVYLVLIFGPVYRSGQISPVFVFVFLCVFLFLTFYLVNRSRIP